MKEVKKKNAKKKRKNSSQSKTLKNVNNHKKVEKKTVNKSETIVKEKMIANDKVNNKKREDKETKIETARENVRQNYGLKKFLATAIAEAIYIFLIEMLFKILLGSFSLDWTIFRIFTSSLFIGLLVSLITTNMHKVPRTIILVVFNFFVALYAWLQMGFMDFLGAFISIGSAEQGTKITDYIGDFLVSIKVSTYSLISMFILPCIYTVIEDKILKNRYKEKINFKKPLVDISLFASLIVCLLVFHLTTSIDFMQNKYQAISNETLLKYPSNPSLTIKNFGTTVYFVLDVKSAIIGSDDEIITSGVDFGEKTVSMTRQIDDTAWEELISKETDSTLNSLNNYFINRNVTEKNEKTGLFEGKNLVMLMLESISAPVFSEYYKEYFPTLYKLSTEGITGTNNFSPRNNCATGESEMTSEISLYSIETTCTANTYKNNVYPQALLYMLKKNGYYTTAYHDYTDQYYYRNVYTYNYGAMEYYGVTRLGMSYNPLYVEWPSDVTFIESAVPYFGIENGKFASYLVTVTGHSPYMYSSEWGNEYVNLFEDLDISTSAKRYLSKVKVVDLALEKLLEELKSKGVLDDTVIVLFGDHYPYALSDEEYASIARFDISENSEIDRTPFIIYNSATPGEEITKYTSPLDYTPTLLNLFGIEYDPRLYMGNDIFSDYKDLVLFPDNSWQTSEGFYNVSKGAFIPKSKDLTLTDDEIIEINKHVNSMRSMSSLAIKRNYMDYLFKELENIEKTKLEEDNIQTETEE